MIPNILKETVRGIQPVAMDDEMLLSRNIFLIEPVTAQSSADLIKQLMYLENSQDNEPITLYINSPGGDVSSGLAVYDYIKTMQSPVNTVCIGMAASMGAILFLSGQTRSMLENSQVMIHDPSFAKNILSGSKPLEIQKQLDKLIDVRKTLVDIIVENSNMNEEEVYNKTKEDTYLTASEAMKLGIATEIIKRK